MSSISSTTLLSSSQLGALRRISELSQAIARNTERLSTLRRINSSRDDPAGLIQSTRLETELAALEAASEGVTRANAMLSTAEATASEIVTQLQEARSKILEAADGSLSQADIAGNQVEVDQILDAVDVLTHTEFDGRRLLDGSQGFRTTGVDTSEILDVDVLDKQTTEDVSVSIEITQQATQATDSYTSGTLGQDTTLVVTGPRGTATISLSNGDDTQTIADAFNAATYLTGVTATRVDANQVDFATLDYGSAAELTIEATEGTFNTTNGGSAQGTDAVATINGQQVTGDGTTFDVHTSSVSLIIEVDPTANGTLNPFVVSGEGLAFQIGPSAGSTARIGLPSLNSATLGSVLGKLSSIRSGGANSLTSGNAANALHIIDDAIADVTRTQAIIGGFRKFTLESASRVMDKTTENVSSALSAIRDVDVAMESALLSQNQLLQKTALEALSLTGLRNDDVLALLQRTVNL